MQALTWQGRGKVSVENVPDPRIEQPTDAVIRVTSTAICGSDLHLLSVLGPFLNKGDVLGHEPMGVVMEVGADVTHIAPGDRVVVPFNISCGSCWMCTRGLFAQCETTQVRDQGSGAALFGYTELYGSVPGGQAEYLRVPQAQFGPIKVPEDVPDERALYLSDILPTAWQAVEYCDLDPDGGQTVVVLGLGPVGQFACRIADLRGHRVIGVDLVADRLAAAEARGIETLDLSGCADLAEELINRVDGRGADAVIDAVGMEAHGSPGKSAAISAVGLLPDALAAPLAKSAGLDQTAALETAVRAVRRGGTVSISGVYGGAADPLPMLTMFDRGITLRMGQCHVKRWIEDIWPVLMADGDPLGAETLATHRVPLAEAPAAYTTFQEKSDHCLKVVLKP